MCEYCGCRDIPLIGRLSEEHYEAVDALGDLRRAIESGTTVRVHEAAGRMADHLFEHNESEEAGLFRELGKDEYFAPTIAELIDQHRQFRTLLARIDEDGDWTAYGDFESLLRHHIDREENGLFPATAVAVDGDTWAAIDRLTHDFNHAHNRVHAHTEAELLAARGGTHHAPPVLESTPAARFSLRPAQVSDAAGLLALWRQCGLPVRLPEAIAEELAGTIALHPELVLVGTAADSIIASAIGTWDGHRGWVNRLATRPDWRGHGIGGALVARIEAGVRALGGRQINLLVGADDFELVGRYEADGYVAEDVIFLEKIL